MKTVSTRGSRVLVANTIALSVNILSVLDLLDLKS